MTMTLTDPGEIRLTGENPIIAIYTDPRSSAPSTQANFWRLLYSPAGPGHAAFLRSDELTNGAPRVYTDNIAAARWLQREILSGNPSSPFLDEALPAVDAVFTREGDIRSFITERISAENEEVLLTWFDFLTPFPIWAPASPTRALATAAIFFPALGTQVTLNGIAAPGKPLPRDRDGKPSSSSFIAWSETWIRPLSS